MSDVKGKIALMGSGELTSTMVEVHKSLLSDLPGTPKAVFLDTPAGFQMNVNQIYQKASEYFRNRIQHPLTLSSYKSGDNISDFEAEKAFHILRDAAYIFIGPGSPTYALRHWKKSPVPEILYQNVRKGGCLVAASAAALTLGRFTLPVYEIYKVGRELHWVEGLDILGRFGFNLIVIPHWNNAEGGDHDTRFCYMGETRFRKLEDLFSSKLPVLGLDEHTACILNFGSGEAEVKGIGRITLRTADRELTFQNGDRFPLDLLPPIENDDGSEVYTGGTGRSAGETDAVTDPEGKRIQELEEDIHRSLEERDFKEAIKPLLELDRLTWQTREDPELESFLARSRDTIRNFIFSLGMEIGSSSDLTECLTPLVETLLKLRQNFRGKRQWAEADAIRDALSQVNIEVKDTEKGYQWQVVSREENEPPD